MAEVSNLSEIRGKLKGLTVANIDSEINKEGTVVLTITFTNGEQLAKL